MLEQQRLLVAHLAEDADPDTLIDDVALAHTECRIAGAEAASEGELEIQVTTGPNILNGLDPRAVQITRQVDVRAIRSLWVRPDWE